MVRQSDLSHTCPLRRLQGGDLWCQIGVGGRDPPKHSSEAHVLLQKVFWIQLIPWHTATSRMFLLVMYLYRCQMSCSSTSFCFEIYDDLPTFSTFTAALPTRSYPQVLFFAFEATGVWHGERTSAEFGRQRDLVWYEGLERSSGGEVLKDRWHPWNFYKERVKVWVESNACLQTWLMFDWKLDFWKGPKKFESLS